MADNIWKDTPINYHTTNPSFIPSSSTDWLGNFALNPIVSMGELVGISPQAEMEKWRMNNPGWAVAGELLGTAVPYAGWVHAAGKIPKLGKAIDWAGGLSKNAFVSGALKETVRQAPFELGRVLASQVVGDQDLGTMAGNAGVNLALGAGLGGVIEGIGSAGTRNLPLSRMAPGVDVSAPFQLQTRFLKEAVSKSGGVLPQNIGPINRAIKDLQLQSRLEYLTSSDEKYVTMLEGMETPAQATLIDRLFKPDFGKSGFRRRRFTSNEKDFGSEEAWIKAAQEAGLPANFEDLGQYVRDVRFEGKSAEKTAKTYGEAIQKNLDSIGDGWYMKRETEDGLWVMAKKAKGTPGKAEATDRWVVLKTDKPGEFHEPSRKWEKGMIKHQAWNPVRDASRDGGRIYNSLKGFKEKFPFFNYQAAAGDAKGLGALAQKALPQGIKYGNELGGKFKDFATEFLTPARLQFTKNARANHIMTALKEAYDAAEAEGTRIVNGSVAVGEGRSLWHSVMGGYDTVTDASKKSLRQTIEALTPRQISEVGTVLRREASGAELQAMHDKGEISKGTLDALKRLEEIDTEIFENLNKAQKAAGQPITKGRAGHYGAGREWKGDNRFVLRGEDGEVKAVAAGYSRGEARKRAEFIKEKMAAEGQAVKVAEEFRTTDLERVPKDVRPLIRTPSFTMERANIRGWHGDFEDRTGKELLEALEGGVRGRMRYQANLATTDLLARDIDKLAIEDPLSHRMVTARMNDRAGYQSAFSQIQNNLTDKLLAPIMGPNSASKIVRVTNSLMWNIQLGAGNIIHPITDALSFIQVVAPEVAFVTTADPSRLGKYTWFASGNGSGGIRGSMGALNPAVLMKDAFVEMRKPSKELGALFTRAANDGVIDPRIVEDYVGESAGKLKNMRAAISSPGGFVDWLKAASEFMPAMVEKGSRAYAFTVGKVIAKDHLGLTDPDDIYLMAKQFTEHTMYSYGASDRPRIMTTPLGGAFGLFKNWMANYTGSMLEYMGEGVMHNNWTPLIWQTAGTFATGGVAAVPMVGAADGFQEMFSGKSMLEMAYEGFNGENEWAANGLMFGLPAALTGYSISGRVASPWTDPVHNANLLYSIAQIDRAQYIGKAAGRAMDNWYATGQAPGGDPRFWQLLARGTAPYTIYRAMAAAQENTISSLSSGYPVTKNASPMERLLFTIGFTPVELERANKVADELYADQAKRQQMTTALAEAFAEAQLRNDSKTMTHIMKQAWASGLDPSAVNRSATARVHKMTTPMLERNFSPEDIVRYKMSGN